MLFRSLISKTSTLNRLRRLQLQVRVPSTPDSQASSTPSTGSLALKHETTTASMATMGTVVSPADTVPRQLVATTLEEDVNLATTVETPMSDVPCPKAENRVSWGRLLTFAMSLTAFKPEDTSTLECH